MPQARNRAIAALFAIGLCLGMVVAERIYIARGGSLPKPRILQTLYDKHHPRHTGMQATGVPHTHVDVLNGAQQQGQVAWRDPTAILPTPDSQPARNELETILRKVGARSTPDKMRGPVARRTSGKPCTQT